MSNLLERLQGRHQEVYVDTVHVAQIAVKEIKHQSLDYGILFATFSYFVLVSC